MMEIRLRQPHSFVQLGRRSNQEDARFPDCDAPQDCRPAFVVCDGVGGCDKGEVASRTVADAIGGAMEDYDLSAPFGVRDFSHVLDYAYGALDRMASPANAGMATTMTFVCFHGAGVFTAHIGDSRIYHVRPGVGIMHRSEDIEFPGQRPRALGEYHASAGCEPPAKQCDHTLYVGFCKRRTR